jgi:hypothetical protein
MKKNSSLVLLLLFISLLACSSDSSSTATSIPATRVVVKLAEDAQPIMPADAEIDRETAMLLGMDLHRQLWATRPTNNYKFGFQWNVGDFAYEKANVEVRVLKNEIDAVAWAENAITTDGSEPTGFVVPDTPNPDQYHSIDGLFKVIGEALDNDPSRVSLGFDSVFGFPTSVVIEFPPGSEHKDVSFFAAQVVPIPGPPE